MPDQPKTKIFILGGEDRPGSWIGHALAEDGQIVASHLSSSENYLRADMGLGEHHTGPGHAKLAKYAAAFPAGFELVDLINKTNDECDASHGFIEAWKRNEEAAADA